MNIRIETYRDRAKLHYRVSVCDGKTLVREEVVNSLEARDELVWSLAQIYDIGDIEFVNKESAKKDILTINEAISIADLNHYFSANPYRIYNQVLDTVEQNLTSKSNTVVFATLEPQGTNIISMRSGWLGGLKLALKYFEDVEDYESCIRAAELIDKLNSYDNTRQTDNSPRR